MALTVTRARVKEKCGVSGSSYDTPIDNLITEQVSVIEFAIEQAYLEDTSNTGLQATLTLAATEIVCGEFLAQKLREPGAADHVRNGDVETVPWRGYDISDPYALRKLGWRRLRPYLKLDPSIPVGGGISSGGDRTGDAISSA